MKSPVCLVAFVGLLHAGIGMAADVPTFSSGEYLVTTSFGDSEALVKKVCLTNYTDWFDSLRDDFKERGCNLVAEGQADAEYRYRMDCSNGTSGTLAVTKTQRFAVRIACRGRTADCGIYADDHDA